MITRLTAAVFPRAVAVALRPWRVWTSAAALFGAAVAASLAVGYHIAAERTLQREAALAQDIGRSLARIIAIAERDRPQLAPLAGQSCARVLAGLTGDKRIALYVRNAFFSRDNRVYCTTVSGAGDVPLSAYISPPGPGVSIAMRAGTPLFPKSPAMVVYDRLSDSAGIGLVVSGAYIDDLLGRVRASGAQSAAITGTDGSAFTSDGRILASFAPGKGWASYPARDALFSVSVQGGPTWRRQDLGDVENVAMLIGMMVGLALAAGYLTGYTPRQRLIRRVRRGLARGEFLVVYQPIVEVATGKWVGAEALVRWQHPRRGLVMPGHFIGEVEDSPVIADLTQFVLRQALKELSAMDLPNGFRLTVNLAAFHAGLRGFPGDLSDILSASQTRLQLVLEITERGLLAGIDGVKDSLARLQRQGVKFAVDDFGTENSNLALLQRFHFDYIKIDRQFVQGVVGNDRALLEGITFLAGQVGAQVVAEGVEERAQQDVLDTIGVPLAQGFLFARPERAKEFAQGYATSAGRPASRVFHRQGPLAALGSWQSG
ncbi:EAL domain-containing protein [Paraburkholderia sp. RL17-337-BIB-A]|uniref:EAL domain-containing protein n=1 Tax=Paraburkholderia sp. RL17-337-BIB-A TaxID=3031636 RepID=UPI0038B8FE90